MKKNIFKYMLLGAALTMGVTSCSDWNDMESVEIKNPTINAQDPVAYAAYVESLKAYKDTDHKIMYVTYDNTIKEPRSIADHMSMVPDSVDIVELQHPDNLTEREVKEMGDLHAKGTKVVYHLSFDECKAHYEAYLTKWAEDHPQETEETSDNVVTRDETEGEEAEEVVETPDDFITVMTAFLNEKLAICDKYPYDGVTFHYNSHTIALYLYGEELETYTNEQNAYFNVFKEWKAAHEDKLFIFHGAAKEILEPAIASSFSYIILDTQASLSISTISYQLELSCRPEIPTDRFLGMTSTPSDDVTDVLTGYFYGERSIPELAYWVLQPVDGATKAGMVIADVQRDYYNASNPYQYARQAIDIMNPSPKK